MVIKSHKSSEKFGKVGAILSVYKSPGGCNIRKVLLYHFRYKEKKKVRNGGDDFVPVFSV